jgi:mannose-6-phosphate isomerase
MKIYEMKNPIKNYAWGSKTFISELLGQKTQSLEPQAELWMGTHPQGISEINCCEEWILLDQFIANHPDLVLGERNARKFDNKLPFLFKILAIDNPLSIQVHPDKIHAVEGFERENQNSIPLSAPNRNFKDPFSKPELVCALTPLWAMCGFRAYEEIQANFLSITNNNMFGQTVFDFFKQLMQLDKPAKKQLIAEAIRYGQSKMDQTHWQWVTRLAKHFPSDIGALAPLYLNIFCLNPGEGLFLKPGILHAYLHGNAVEIMNNSDNVIRGGLTVKHIDVETLLNIVSTSSEAITPIHPQMGQINEWHYDIPVDNYSLTRYDLNQHNGLNINVDGPQIMLCTRGKIQISQDNEHLYLKPGMSAFVSHEAHSYSIRGDGVVYKAGTNLGIS